jgi:hypothetical protein
MGTGAIGFKNGVVFGVFVDVTMLCYRQSEKKPANAPLTQKYGCGVAPKTVAARFYAARNFETIAHAYLRNARYCYLRWGALGLSSRRHASRRLRSHAMEFTTPPSTRSAAPVVAEALGLAR